MNHIHGWLSKQKETHVTSGHQQAVEHKRNEYYKRGKENEGWIDQGLHRSGEEFLYHPRQ